MKEEGSLRRGFVYGKFRIIISVSSAIFRFRWDDFIEYAQKINVEEFKWVFHAQVVFKGHQLCMVKAMVIFFEKTIEPDATEEMPLRTSLSKWRRLLIFCVNKLSTYGQLYWHNFLERSKHGKSRISAGFTDPILALLVKFDNNFLCTN